MSEIWPFDVKNRLSNTIPEPIRAFNCIMLMPFEKRFDQVADVIKTTVLQVLEEYDMHKGISDELPHIERLDWITSSGVIQQEIWEKIANAGLVFCDLTGYNSNVMFEAGVSAGWKVMTQVVFIKDHFFKQQSAFDIAPIRYTEYELTTDGIREFRRRVAKLTLDVLISFPDRQGNPPAFESPVEINFQENKDDIRIYTPPYAHRRIVDSALEFGSIQFYPHSWATIGKKAFYNFQIDFAARFSNPIRDDAWIGIGLRSQHYYANYSHLFYINAKGMVVITEPNEDAPPFYKDNIMRPAGDQNVTKDDHTFSILFSDSILRVQVDDFPREFQLSEMKKVLGPGLLRFQSWQTWMALKRLRVNESIGV